MPESEVTPRHRFPPRGLNAQRGLLLLLALLLLLIQATAILGIVDSRRRAEQVALLELDQAVAAQAATLEAALATLYGDLRYFVHSWAVAEAPRLLAVEDPVARRWSRLDLEGAALVFLDSHPALARIYVERTGDELLTAVGWRQGSPVILRQEEIAAGPPDGLAASVWQLRAPRYEVAGRVRTWLDPDRLISEVLPAADGLTLVAATSPVSTMEGEQVVRAAVRGGSWQPAINWSIERRVAKDELLGSMQPILAGFRRTLVFNLVIIAASTLLGVALMRQTRRAATAEAELRHREDRRKLERQVQHSERLAAVGRLAAGVAHEINNPLSGVVNYLSLLGRELDDGNVDAARDLVRQIREGTDSAAKVVQQVLTFAEPGHADHQPLDLAAVTRRTFDFVAANPEYRHLRLEFSSPDTPLEVEGDASALSQLLLNLLLNACELQRRDGRVEVRLSRRGEDARLEVMDRGPGLSEEALEHLFEPFYSSRNSTGLGLAVCHGIVRAHGGSISAANRSGGGAQLVVDLPLAKLDRSTVEQSTSGQPWEESA